MTFLSQINLLLHAHRVMMMMTTSSPHFSYFLSVSSWFRSLFVLSIHLTLIKTHHERELELNWTEMQSDKTNSIPHRRPSILLLLLLALAIHTPKTNISKLKLNDDWPSLHYWISYVHLYRDEMKIVTSLRVCSWRKARKKATVKYLWVSHSYEINHNRKS